MTKKKTQPKTEARPVGRPTVYDDSYPQKLIEHMAAGFSYESFAGVIGTFRTTLYNWEKIYPEFLDAKKEGSDRNLLFWEKAGHEGLFEQTEYNSDGKPIYSKKLNSTVWIFSMKNRHKWKDKQEIEMAKEDEADKLKKMSNAELRALVQGIIEDREKEE